MISFPPNLSQKNPCMRHISFPVSEIDTNKRPPLNRDIVCESHVKSEHKILRCELRQQSCFWCVKVEMQSSLKYETVKASE